MYSPSVPFRGAHWAIVFAVIVLVSAPPARADDGKKAGEADPSGATALAAEVEELKVQLREANRRIDQLTVLFEQSQSRSAAAATAPTESAAPTATAAVAPVLRQEPPPTP